MNWDDLRYVLAIARGGSLGSAAKLLDMNASSVYRRLEALEKTLGVRVFERRRRGYELTVHGRVLAETASKMEEHTLAAERKVLGADHRLSGKIRLSTSEPIGLYLLPPLLARFVDRYPQLEIELSISNELADLTRRDADVVVRGTAAPPEHLVGRRAANIYFAAYAATRYLDNAGRGRALNEYEWLGYIGSQLKSPQARWLSRLGPGLKSRYSADSLAAMVALTRQGVGATALACFVGDSDPLLERLTTPEPAEQFGIWLLTHRDLRRTTRVRAFTQFMGDAIRDETARIMGQPQ